MSDIAYLNATEIIRQLSSGELNAETLVDTYLQRIERYDENLHSFVNVYAEDARAAAEAADKSRKAGHAVGPLHGIPVAVKDIIDIENRTTTGGSAVWTNRISSLTATLVKKMLAAGMIIIGKTHSVEFAMGGWGTNQHMGTPRNPWDITTHRAPGGSSAGSGVSVAAGLAPWAIGTDTGGSVRLPSAWCGLTGLKTTIGRISCHGVLPLSTTLDTPGPMCRTVEDAAVLFEVLAGPDAADPITLGHDASATLQRLNAGVHGLRIGRITDSEREVCDTEVLAAYDRSLECFKDLGAVIVDVVLPRTFDELGALVGRLIGTEAYAIVGEMIDDLSLPIDEDVRPRIWLGKDVSARQYYQLLKEIDAVNGEFDQALAGVDALLTPTVATPAPAIETIDQTGSPAGFTRLVNLIRRCALTQPNGFTDSGLPIAHQIICAQYDEATALRIGCAYERITDWTQRHPSL